MSLIEVGKKGVEKVDLLRVHVIKIYGVPAMWPGRSRCGISAGYLGNWTMLVPDKHHSFQHWLINEPGLKTGCFNF